MKIRNGFVSNSSSSAFILSNVSPMGMDDLRILAMAFDKIQVMDNGDILITYSCGSDLAEKILAELLPWANIKTIAWTDVD